MHVHTNQLSKSPSLLTVVDCWLQWRCIVACGVFCEKIFSSFYRFLTQKEYQWVWNDVDKWLNLSKVRKRTFLCLYKLMHIKTLYTVFASFFKVLLSWVRSVFTSVWNMVSSFLCYSSIVGWYTVLFYILFLFFSFVSCRFSVTHFECTAVMKGEGITK